MKTLIQNSLLATCVPGDCSGVSHLSHVYSGLKKIFKEHFITKIAKKYCFSTLSTEICLTTQIWPLMRMTPGKYLHSKRC